MKFFINVLQVLVIRGPHVIKYKVTLYGMDIPLSGFFVSSWRETDEEL